MMLMKLNGFLHSPVNDNKFRCFYSNLAEEVIAKQFPTERREMIFCAIPMTEKWPFFLAYDDRKEAVLALDGYRRQHFFSVGNQIFLFHNFNTATHGAHKN
jgi:hypothetical protein